MMDGASLGAMAAWMLLGAALVVVPFWRLLPRFGVPAWLSLAAVFPPLALLLLWVMAFARDTRERSA